MILIGHRGARLEVPENTVPSFRHAVKLGLTGVEFDLHLTADGEIVVIHDATVDRTTNGTGAVADLTLDELQALDARAAFPDWPEPCRIPTFAEVLDVVQGLDRLEVELKAHSTEEMRKLIELASAEMEQRGLTKVATLTSFEAEALTLARELAPAFNRGFIGSAEDASFLATALDLGCSRIGARLASASPEVVASALEAGLEVVAWPVNTPEDLAKALALGATHATTDAPSIVMPALAAS